jgi:two-component system LytT family response regulator
MPVYTAVVVDDEARNIALFSYYLEKYCPDIQLLAAYTKKGKAISFLKQTKPDILFLDIVLDIGSGFDVLDAVGHEGMQVVLCTAHDEFALRAIRYQVVDYLLKPLEIQDLINTVDKIKHRLNGKDEQHVFDASLFSEMKHNTETSKQRLPLINKGAIDFVDTADVLSAESIKSSARCKVVMRHHKKGEHMLVSQTLMQMEEKLPKSIFFRAGKTCIINVSAIKTIHRNVQYVCNLINDHRVILSRKGYKELIEFIEKVYQTKI